MTEEVLQEKIKVFCSLSVNLMMIGFAADMVAESDDKEQKEAWRYVQASSAHWMQVEFPLLPGESLISKVYKVLGPDIALKLYEFYLSEVEKLKLVPSFLLSLEELNSMRRESVFMNPKQESIFFLHKRLERISEAMKV